MNKIGAIGVVEVTYYSNGVLVLDEMLKSADVALLGWHRLLGGKMVHIIIHGDVSSVNAAMDAARKCDTIVGENNIKIVITISNPHPEIVNLVTNVAVTE